MPHDRSRQRLRRADKSVNTSETPQAWWLVGYAYPDTPIVGPFDSRDDAERHRSGVIYPPWWRVTNNVQTPQEASRYVQRT
jgi:hypothetical protein